MAYYELTIFGPERAPGPDATPEQIIPINAKDEHDARAQAEAMRFDNIGGGHRGELRSVYKDKICDIALRSN